MAEEREGVWLNQTPKNCELCRRLVLQAAKTFKCEAAGGVTKERKTVHWIVFDVGGQLCS